MKVIGETLSVVNIIIDAWLKLMQFFWDRGISKIQQLHLLEDKPEKCSAWTISFGEVSLMGTL